MKIETPVRVEPAAFALQTKCGAYVYISRWESNALIEMDKRKLAGKSSAVLVPLYRHAEPRALNAQAEAVRLLKESTDHLIDCLQVHFDDNAQSRRTIEWDFYANAIICSNEAFLKEHQPPGEQG